MIYKTFIERIFVFMLLSYLWIFSNNHIVKSDSPFTIMLDGVPNIVLFNGIMEVPMELSLRLFISMKTLVNSRTSVLLPIGSHYSLAFYIDYQTIPGPRVFFP